MSNVLTCLHWPLSPLRYSAEWTPGGAVEKRHMYISIAWLRHRLMELSFLTVIIRPHLTYSHTFLIAIHFSFKCSYRETCS